MFLQPEPRAAEQHHPDACDQQRPHERVGQADTAESEHRGPDEQDRADDPAPARRPLRAVRSITCECTCDPLSFWPKRTTSPACARPSTSTVASFGTITRSLPTPTSARTNVCPFGSSTFAKSRSRRPTPSVYFECTSLAS